MTGSYVDLLEGEKYVTSVGTRNSHWRINDNLLGPAAHCPMVRRTRELDTLLHVNIPDRIAELRAEFPPKIFQRSTDYLYRKEARSSYEMEREEPSPDRVEKFIALLYWPSVCL